MVFMFYSSELLCAKGALGQIWVRAETRAEPLRAILTVVARVDRFWRINLRRRTE